MGGWQIPNTYSGGGGHVVITDYYSNSLKVVVIPGAMLLYALYVFMMQSGSVRLLMVVELILGKPHENVITGKSGWRRTFFAQLAIICVADAMLMYAEALNRQ